MQRNLTPVDSLAPLLKDAYPAFTGLLRFLRLNYRMDELWDGKRDLRLRKGGRTLISMRLREGGVLAMLLFDAAECAALEARAHTFSPCTRALCRGGKSQQGSLRVYIDLEDETCLAELIELIQIKQRPNRRDDYDPAALARCGNNCGACLLYARNNEDGLRGNLVFHEMDWHCYNTPDEPRTDYTGVVCPGCAAKAPDACPSLRCLSEKGLDSCYACDYAHCATPSQIQGFDPAKCNLGITAEEMTQAVMPYCGRARYDAMRARAQG